MQASDKDLRNRQREIEDRLWKREGFDMSGRERRRIEGELAEIEQELGARRAAAVRRRHESKAAEGCPFCDYAGPNTVLYEDRDCYVVEPLRQVTPGHVLVIPKQHATDFADSAEVTAKTFRSAAYFAQSEEIEDCNLITSKGASASQTVRHIHVHILPRRWGDNVRLPWGNPNPEPNVLTEIPPGAGF